MTPNELYKQCHCSLYTIDLDGITDEVILEAIESGLLVYCHSKPHETWLPRLIVGTAIYRILQKLGLSDSKISVELQCAEA